jgi:indole-3-glycerol phosphate synthase
MLGMSADFLNQMAVGSRRRAEAAKRVCPDAELLARALASPLPPRLRRHAAGFDLIAEMKLRSPAVGQLKSGDEDVNARVTAYARAGAAAVSVLTEPSRFDGSMAHLEQATSVLTPLQVPAMRKDFIVDAYQVSEARVAGAGGVLVILRMLPRAELDALIERARELRLFVLLEAFDAADIEVMHDIVAAHARSGVEMLAGVNCRDLTTLQIVPPRLDELAHLLPTSVPRVAESGVGSAEDARRVAAVGYELALVGSALMQGGDPRALATAMLEAGRGARVARQGAGSPHTGGGAGGASGGGSAHAGGEARGAGSSSAHTGGEAGGAGVSGSAHTGAEAHGAGGGSGSARGSR